MYCFLCSENFIPNFDVYGACLVCFCCGLRVNNWDNLKKIGHLLPFIYRLSPAPSRSGETGPNTRQQFTTTHSNLFVFSFQLFIFSKFSFSFFFLWLYHYEFYVSGLQTLFEARYSIIKHHYVGWMYSGAKSRENVSHLLEKCERIQ